MQNDITDEQDCSKSSGFPLPLSLAKRQSKLPSHEQLPEPPDAVSTGPRSIDNNIILGLNSPMDELKKTRQFICGLQGATLEDSNMQQTDIDRLRAADLGPCLDTEDRHFIKSL